MVFLQPVIIIIPSLHLGFLTNEDSLKGRHLAKEYRGKDPFVKMVPSFLPRQPNF